MTRRQANQLRTAAGADWRAIDRGIEAGAVRYETERPTYIPTGRAARVVIVQPHRHSPAVCCWYGARGWEAIWEAEY